MLKNLSTFASEEETSGYLSSIANKLYDRNSTLEFIQFLSSQAPESLPVFSMLCKLARESDLLVKSSAVDALTKYPFTPKGIIEDLLQKPKSIKNNYSAGYLGIVEQLLNDPYPTIRASAIKMISGWVYDTRSATIISSIITQMLNDSSEDVRYASISALNSSELLHQENITLENKHIQIITGCILETNQTHRHSALAFVRRLVVTSYDQAQIVFRAFQEFAFRYYFEKQLFFRTVFEFGGNNCAFVQLLAVDKLGALDCVCPSSINISDLPSLVLIVMIIAAYQKTPFPLPKYILHFAKVLSSTSLLSPHAEISSEEPLKISIERPASNTIQTSEPYLPNQSFVLCIEGLINRVPEHEIKIGVQLPTGEVVYSPIEFCDGAFHSSPILSLDSWDPSCKLSINVYQDNKKILPIDTSYWLCPRACL